MISQDIHDKQTFSRFMQVNIFNNFDGIHRSQTEIQTVIDSNSTKSCTNLLCYTDIMTESVEDTN